jgi:2Fe-2S ferredoxin
MAQIVFIEKNGKHRAYTFTAGESILAVARRNKLDLEGACDGLMACATCHVIIDAAWAALLPKPVAEESEMLEIAPGVTRTSRLGCQVKLVDALDGITVKIA